MWNVKTNCWRLQVVFIDLSELWTPEVSCDLLQVTSSCRARPTYIHVDWWPSLSEAHLMSVHNHLYTTYQRCMYWSSKGSEIPQLPNVQKGHYRPVAWAGQFLHNSSYSYLILRHILACVKSRLVGSPQKIQYCFIIATHLNIPLYISHLLIERLHSW